MYPYSYRVSHIRTQHINHIVTTLHTHKPIFKKSLNPPLRKPPHVSLSKPSKIFRFECLINTPNSIIYNEAFNSKS